MRCWITFVFRNPEDWRWNELALAVLTASKHYAVTVVTNHTTRIRDLGLPCQTTHRTFAEHHPWSVHKLLTYSHAPLGEPFLHIDSDVFLWDRLPDSIEDARLFAQSWEGPEHYAKHPSPTWAERYAPAPHAAYNVGIFGGDPHVVRQYASMALASAEEWPSAKATYVEQLTLGRFSQNIGVPVHTFTAPGNPDVVGYTHLMDASHRQDVQRRISDRLLRDYPEVAAKLGVRKPMLSVCVSRGRVNRLVRAVDSWMETRTMADMVIALDYCDPEADAAISALKGYDHVQFVRGPRKGFAQTFDQVCRDFSRKYDALGMAANDLVFCSPAWDRTFYDALAKHKFMGVVYGQDGRWNQELATHAYFGAKLFEKIGTVVDPEQRHLWVDNNLMEIGRKTRMMYLPEVLIRHDHYGVKPELTDADYLRCNSGENYQHDKACHERFTQTVVARRL